METGAVLRVLATITDHVERDRAVRSVVAASKDPGPLATQLLLLLSTPPQASCDLPAAHRETETCVLLMACEIVLEAPDQVNTYIHDVCLPTLAAVVDPARPTSLERRAAASVACMAERIGGLLEQLMPTIEEGLKSESAVLPAAAAALLLEAVSSQLTAPCASLLLCSALEAAHRGGEAANMMVGRLVPKLLLVCEEPAAAAALCWQHVCALWDQGLAGESATLLSGSLEALMEGPLNQSGVGGTEPAALWSMLPDMIQHPDPLLRKHAVHVLRAVGTNCEDKAWSKCWGSWLQLYSTFQEAVLHLTKAVWPDLLRLIAPSGCGAPQLPSKWVHLVVQCALSNPNVHVRKFATLHLLDHDQLLPNLPPSLVFGALFEAVNACHLLHAPRAAIRATGGASTEQPRETATRFFGKYAELHSDLFVPQIVAAVGRSVIRHDVLLYYLELIGRTSHAQVLGAETVRMVAQIMTDHVAASAPALRQQCWVACVRVIGSAAIEWHTPDQLLQALHATAAVPTGVWRQNETQQLLTDWAASAAALDLGELCEQLLSGAAEHGPHVVARACALAGRSDAGLLCAAAVLDGAAVRPYADLAKVHRAVALVEAIAALEEAATATEASRRAISRVSGDLIALTEQTAARLLDEGSEITAEELETLELQLSCVKGCAAAAPSAAFADSAQRLLLKGAEAVAKVEAGAERCLIGLLLLEHCTAGSTALAAVRQDLVVRAVASSCQLPLQRLPNTMMPSAQLRSRLLLARHVVISAVARGLPEQMRDVRETLWAAVMSTVEEIHGSFAVAVFEAVGVLAEDSCNEECVEQLAAAVWSFVTESSHKSSLRSGGLARAIASSLFREQWLLRHELAAPLSQLLQQLLSRRDKLPVLLGEVVVQCCAVFAAHPAASIAWVGTLSLLCRAGPPGEHDDADNPTFRADHPWSRAIVNRMLADAAPMAEGEALVHGLAEALLERDCEISADTDCCKLGHELHREQVRLWQTLCILAEHAPLPPRLVELAWTALEADHLPSVRVFLEAFVARHVLADGGSSSVERVVRLFEDCNPRNQTAVSAVMVGRHVLGRVEDSASFIAVLRGVLRFCACANHSVRALAMLAVHAAVGRASASPGLLLTDELLQLLTPLASYCDLNKDCAKLRKQLSGHPQNKALSSEGGAAGGWANLCSFQTIFETIPAGNRDLAGEGIPEALFDAITGALKGATSALGSHAPAHIPTSVYKLDAASADGDADGADFQTKISPWEESCFDSREEAHMNKRRQQLVVVASCIDKVPNLAGIARTAEIFNLSKLVLHSKKVAQDKLFQQCSVTAEKWLPIEEVPEHKLEQWLVAQKELGWSIVALEQTANSVCITQFEFPQKCIVVLGEEQRGVPVELIKLVDTCVEIPQLGVLRSLNVHVSASLLIWEYSKQQHFSLPSC